MVLRDEVIANEAESEVLGLPSTTAELLNTKITLNGFATSLKIYIYDYQVSVYGESIILKDSDNTVF